MQNENWQTKKYNVRVHTVKHAGLVEKIENAATSKSKVLRSLALVGLEMAQNQSAFQALLDCLLELYGNDETKKAIDAYLEELDQADEAMERIKKLLGGL